MDHTTRSKSGRDPSGAGAAVGGGDGDVPCPACLGESPASIGVRDVLCPHCDGDGRVPLAQADIIQRKLKAKAEPVVGGDAA